MSKIYIPKRTEELQEEFFARNSESVAKDLLGRTLVRERKRKKDLYASIREISAYEGQSSSMTKGVLYTPGTLIVSTKYGRNLLDISTQKIGDSSCITLISAIVGERGEEGELVKGPGNLTKALEIDKDSFDGWLLTLSPLWIGGQTIENDRVIKRNKSNMPSNCVGYFYFK